MSGPEENDAKAEPSESDLLRNRRQNLQKVEELGFAASPLRFDIGATVSEVRARYSSNAASPTASRRT